MSTDMQEEHEAIRRTKGNNESLSWDDYRSMSFTKNVSSAVNLIHRFMSIFYQTLMATSCSQNHVLCFFPGYQRDVEIGDRKQ